MSLGADVLPPLGVLKEEVVTGFGGSADLNLLLSGQMGLTMSIGFVSFEGRKDTMASFEGVPIRGGVKVYPTSSFYCAGQVGAFFLTGKRGHSAALSVCPIVGLELPLGLTTSIDLSARYDYVNLPRGWRADLGFRVAAGFRL